MTTAPIVVRRAAVADAALLSDLARRTFNDTFADLNTRADMDAHNARTYAIDKQRAEIESKAIQTLLAESGGEAVAYAQLRTQAPPACVAARPTIELWRFYVDKSMIGHGVAQPFMASVLEHAAASTARTIWLGVWERNARAIAFYRKCGFVEIGSHVFDLGSDRQTDLIFERSLAT